MNSYLRVDRYILDVLLRDLTGHDRSPASFLVYLHLWSRRSEGIAALSYLDIASATGLSKRAVQGAIARLARRKLIAVTRASPTAVPVYEVKTPWRRPAA